MKEEISSLELYYLTSELKQLESARVDKIFQKERIFLFTFHLRNKGKKILRIALPSMIYLTEYKEMFSGDLPGFCTFLRKKLSNSFIESIQQKGFERILKIVFRGKEEFFTLIIELFGNGNLILCDENFKILSALETHNWRDRTLRGGITYEYPPAQNNTLLISEEKFEEIIRSSTKDMIVKTLAVKLNLGGLYAEELCLLSKVDKNTNKLTKKQLKTLYGALKGLLSKKVSSVIINDEIFPFELELFKNEETRENFSSFNEAIDSHLSQKMILNDTSKGKQLKNKELEKIQTIIHHQNQTILGLKQSHEENQKKGEFIYEHYSQIKKILEDFSTARNKYGWKEIKDHLKNHETIKNVKEKEGKIVLEL